MKIFHSLCSVALMSIAGLLCSCTTTTRTYSVDLGLNFETSSDVSSMTIRQYEVLRNGESIMTKTISNEYFSQNEVVLNLLPPATIEVKVFCSFSAGVLPDQMNVRNTYEISGKVDGQGVTYKNTDSSTTIPQASISDYINNVLNYTLKFKLNEDGSLSKAQ